LFIVDPSIFGAPSMKKRSRQDRDVQGNGKAHHPFQQEEFGLDLDKAAVDPAKRRHGNGRSLAASKG
jgi:hypothetical protein